MAVSGAPTRGTRTAQPPAVPSTASASARASGRGLRPIAGIGGHRRRWGGSVFDPEPRLGFLAQARTLEARIDSGAVPAEKVAETRRLVFNNRLDAAVTGVLAGLILLLIAEVGFEWYRILSGRREAVLRETHAERLDRER